MSEFRWKEIEFDQDVVKTISFFNSILADLNAPKLLENSDFNVYEGFTFERVLSLTLAKDNCVSLQTTLSDGIRIDIDLMNEFIEWTKDDIENSKERIVDFIKKVLTSYILIETSGSSRLLHYFNNQGVHIGTDSYNRIIFPFLGFYLKSKNFNQVLYFPIYPNK